MTTIITDAGSAEIATEKVLRMHFYGPEPQVGGYARFPFSPPQDM